MPAPVWYSAFIEVLEEFFSRVRVRMAMLNRASPLVPKYPIAPVKSPRGVGSSSWIISRARFFGAPLMEPPGKQLRSASMGVTSSRRRP